MNTTYSEAFQWVEDTIKNEAKRGAIDPALMGKAIHKLWLIGPQETFDRPYHRFMEGELITLAEDTSCRSKITIQRGERFKHQLTLSIRTDRGTHVRVTSLYRCESPASFAARVLLDCEASHMNFKALTVAAPDFRYKSGDVLFRRANMIVLCQDASGWVVLGSHDAALEVWRRNGIQITYSAPQHQ